jgi:hypothetical protein
VPGALTLTWSPFLRVTLKFATVDFRAVHRTALVGVNADAEDNVRKTNAAKE